MKWRLLKKKITEIKPYEKNPRRLTKKGMKDLSKSIDKFGIAEPIVINKDGTIIGGHARYLTLKEKGIKEVDCYEPEKLLSEKELKELNIRLNKNIAGEFDFDILANEYEIEDLIDWGFQEEELDLDLFYDKGDEKLDDIPGPPKEAISKLGDIFLIDGKHRVMCGDSTNKADVEILMNGGKADMVFTDPPYNVNYGSSKNPRHKIREIIGDKQTSEEWGKFNISWLEQVINNYKGGDIYVWGASGPEGMRQRLWIIEMGFHWSATICWVKDRLVLTPAKYQRQYEPCFYGWYTKSSYCGDRKQTEVWDIKRPSNSESHPTMKPLELCERAIKNSSKMGQIVLDLFLGSGSTLIAAEKTNRICYGMEIDPIYIDVILKRYKSIKDDCEIKCLNREIDFNKLFN